MKAFAFDEFGQPGSVHELPVPEPAAGEVRVRVAAASINPFDGFVIKGYMKDRLEHRFPLIPTSDFAGVIDALGPDVDGFSVGDSVFGLPGHMIMGVGSLAEYTIASAGTIAKRSAGLGDVEAAAMPLAGVSALQCVEAVELRNGQTVLVVGAGGVGSYAVQIAAMRGARVVGVTSADKLDYVRDLGAAEVIDRGAVDVLEASRSAQPGGYDAIIDTVNDAAGLAHLAQLVRNGGRVASMKGVAAADELAKRQVVGVNIQTKITSAPLSVLAKMFEEGKLRATAIDVFTLDHAGDAWSDGGRARQGQAGSQDVRISGRESAPLVVLFRIPSALAVARVLGL